MLSEQPASLWDEVVGACCCRRRHPASRVGAFPRRPSPPLATHPQVALNPFHTPTTKITAPLFHQKVRQLARSYFR